MNQPFIDGETIYMAQSDRTIRHVTPKEFRDAANVAGWDARTIDLFLRSDIVKGSPVVVRRPVPCGSEALILTA